MTTNEAVEELIPVVKVLLDRIKELESRVSELEFLFLTR